MSSLRPYQRLANVCIFIVLNPFPTPLFRRIQLYHVPWQKSQSKE
jgi:hypothetical protein